MHRSWVLGVICLLAACTVDDGPEPSVDAGYPTGDGVPDADLPSAAFDEVHPILLAKCGDCHGAAAMNITKFVGRDLAATYAAVTGTTALVGNFTASTAPLLTRLAPMHQGLAYTAAESAAITTWLDDEVATRFPATVNPANTETPSEATLRLMTAYKDCMNIPDAQTLGGWLTAPDPVKPSQACDNCHATAGYGFLASRDATFHGDNLRRYQQLIAQYYIVDLGGGVANARVIVNSANFERVASRQGPHADHPPFDVSATSEGMQAIAAAYVADCPQ